MRNWLFYILGCVLFSLGAKLFIDSNLGTDPLDVMIIGISNHTGFLLGTISTALSAIFLSTWMFLNKKLPPMTCFLTMGGVGYLIDLWNYIGKFPGNAWVQLLSGLIAVSSASALIIHSKIGIRIMDLLALTFKEKWNMNFTLSKMIFEISFLTIGIVLGGPAGIGTVLFVLIVGTMIEPSLKLLERYF